MLSRPTLEILKQLFCENPLLAISSLSSLYLTKGIETQINSTER